MDRPRIGFVIGQLHRGGAEKQMTELVLGLARDHGMVPIVYCLSTIVDPHGQMLREHGVELRVFPTRGVRKLTRPLALSRAMARDAVRVVQTFLIGPAVHGALANLTRSTPLVAAYRSVEQERPAARRRIESWALNRAEIVTVNARSGIEFVNRYYGVDADRIRYIPNGIDLAEVSTVDRSTARQRLGIPADARVILGVSRLSPEKNLPLFCDVAEAALQGESDGLCLIAGDGPEMESLRRRVALAKSPEKFRVLGATDEVPLLLAASDLFLLTSRHEGTPNSLMEAMAASLPVVATAVGDVPELVRHAETGYRCGPDDDAGLVKACRRLLRDPVAAAEVGRRGRARIAARYSMERMVAQYATLYAKLAVPEIGAGIVGSETP